MNKGLKIIVGVVLVDQLSKYLVSFLGFNIVSNRGVSFGLLSFISADAMVWLMLFLVVLMFFLLKKEWSLHPVALGLFFGGAVSNIFDRIFYGAVRDWLKVPLFDLSNNLADWFVFIGLAMFVLYNTNKKMYKKIN